MSCDLYVGNLAYKAGSEDLIESISPLCCSGRLHLERASVPLGKGRNRGYGFITLSWPRDAQIDPADICTNLSGVVKVHSRPIYLCATENSNSSQSNDTSANSESSAFSDRSEPEYDDASQDASDYSESQHDTNTVSTAASDYSEPDYEDVKESIEDGKAFTCRINYPQGASNGSNSVRKAQGFPGFLVLPPLLVQSAATPLVRRQLPPHLGYADLLPARVGAGARVRPPGPDQRRNALPGVGSRQDCGTLPPARTPALGTRPVLHVTGLPGPGSRLPGGRPARTSWTAEAAIAALTKGSTGSAPMQRQAVHLIRIACENKLDLILSQVQGLALVEEGINGASRAGTHSGTDANLAARKDAEAAITTLTKGSTGSAPMQRQAVRLIRIACDNDSELELILLHVPASP
jgi:hypothetical protein